MKQVILMVCILPILISSCIGIEDKDGMVPEIKYFYINNSSYNVKITAMHTSIPANILDSIVPVGDTIQYWNYTFGDAVTGPFGTPAEPITVILTFMDTANKCLTFAGPISESGDIRSNIYYSDLGERIRNLNNRCYMITNDLFAKAEPCP